MFASASKIVSPTMAVRLVWSALLGLALHGVALAQPGDTVSWTVSAPSADNVKPGSQIAIELHGTVVDGWHVYALEQLPKGPIPLRVALDPSEIAVADGAPTATPPTKFHDPSFNLDTEYYAKPFTVTLPVRVGTGVAAGPQQIPVSVRFQTCNGKTCRPPKTIHLSAAINVRKVG